MDRMVWDQISNVPVPTVVACPTRNCWLRQSVLGAFSRPGSASHHSLMTLAGPTGPKPAHLLSDSHQFNIDFGSAASNKELLTSHASVYTVPEISAWACLYTIEQYLGRKWDEKHTKSWKKWHQSGKEKVFVMKSFHISLWHCLCRKSCFSFLESIRFKSDDSEGKCCNTCSRKSISFISMARIWL